MSDNVLTSTPSEHIHTLCMDEVARLFMCVALSLSVTLCCNTLRQIKSGQQQRGSVFNRTKIKTEVMCLHTDSAERRASQHTKLSLQ